MGRNGAPSSAPNAGPSPTSSPSRTAGCGFHDLRHCYATWLVSRGLPVNAVQHVMGHEQPSTTLNLYTHAPTDYYDTIRRALADVADFPPTFEINSAAEDAANHDRNRADQGR
jgi:hypothetical protein